MIVPDGGAQMTIAKLFMNGRSQAVRLPKEFRFEDADEVMIKRMGDVVMLIPKNKWEDIFVNALRSFPKDVEFDRVDNKSEHGRDVDL
jgi:antitoxin VapB